MEAKVTGMQMSWERRRKEQQMTGHDQAEEVESWTKKKRIGNEAAACLLALLLMGAAFVSIFCVLVAPRWVLLWHQFRPGVVTTQPGQGTSFPLGSRVISIRSEQMNICYFIRIF